MTSVLAPAPVFRGVDNNGNVAYKGSLGTFAAGTTTPQATYVDSTQTTQNLNPVILNARGEANVWLDPTLAYKLVLSDAGGNILWTVDNIVGPYYISGSLIPHPTNTWTVGSPFFTFANAYLGTSGVPLLDTTSGNILFYARTAAEISAGVTPTSYTYPPGNLLRYGLVPNSSSSGAANFAALKALFNPAVTGPTGDFIFPNTTGSDVYYIGIPGSITTCVVPIRDGCRLNLMGCTIQFNGTGTSPADNNSGCFFALRDFEIKNGNIVVNWATSSSTAAGNAIQCGTRGTDSSYWPATWDSLLSVPQGNVRLLDLRITMNVSGINLAFTAAIAFIGGLKGVLVENVFINGSGTLTQFVTQEFGWATSDSQPSARQTSHMSDFVYRNVRVSNGDNVASTSAGLVFAAAYQGVVQNYSFTGVSNGVTSSSGESMFFRPQAGVDDIGNGVSAHKILFKNITGTNFSFIGMNLSGTTARSAGSGYLQRAWVALTAYGVRETVINGGNMYVCTIGGTSAGAGGPSGTGTGIVDGSVTWNFVPLTANTDQIDYIVDGFSLAGNTGSDGIATSAGYISLKDGKLSGMTNGLFFFAECTRFDIEGLTAVGAQNAGFEIGSSAGQIWGTLRLKKGSIKNCIVVSNSVASAGGQPGIHIDNSDGVLVENNRINADSAYGGTADATQGSAVQIGSNAFGVICRLNHVGTINGGGGNAAYLSAAATDVLNGNDIQNPSGTITMIGPWNTDGTGQATTAELTSKTASINTVRKYFGRRCINSSNNRMLTAAGPNNTDVWTYVDGNAPVTITPV